MCLCLLDFRLVALRKGGWQLSGKGASHLLPPDEVGKNLQYKE